MSEMRQIRSLREVGEAQLRNSHRSHYLIIDHYQNVNCSSIQSSSMACNPEATTLSSSSQTVASNSSSSSSSSDQNLFTSINRDHVWSVNTQSPESGKAVIKPWDKRFDATEFTQSLNDEDLKGMVIINVPFVCPVRIRSILINPGRGEFAVRVSKECHFGTTG